MFDTIVAISSGNINQAISIIRIVGPEAVEIIKKIFTGKVGKNKTIVYGFIKDKNKILDEVLVNFFIGKENFVGEDTIEINAHGGIVVTNKILNLILSHGARLALPGEFTRRAYLNGKMSLMKAEAINDLINSKTSKQQEIAINSFMDSKREKLINDFIKDLEHLIGLCEVNIDYPEYDDIPILENQEFNNKINILFDSLNNIVKLVEANSIYNKPLNIAIVGNPNAGKSALMNAIINDEKSIVTNIPGTTRDVIESEIVFNNLILKFKDTAGIRKSKNEIEKIGIERSWKEIKTADVILHVIDSTQGLNKIDEDIIKNIDNKKYIQLWNKSDQVSKKDENLIYISAINKDIKNLEDSLNKLFNINENIDIDYSFNQRQLANLTKATNALSNAKLAIDNGLTFDVIIVDLHEAWEALMDIVGNVDKEKLLDSIFKNFCLGK